MFCHWLLCTEALYCMNTLWYLGFGYKWQNKHGKNKHGKIILRCSVTLALMLCSRLDFCNFIFNSVCMCTCECKYPWSLEEGIKSPTTGVTTGWEPANVGAKNCTWMERGSSARATRALNCLLISPALKWKIEGDLSWSEIIQTEWNICNIPHFCMGNISEVVIKWNYKRLCLSNYTFRYIWYAKIQHIINYFYDVYIQNFQSILSFKLSL